VTSGGFSPKRLARVRDVLCRHLDVGYVPGAVAVIARRGEVHVEAAGHSGVRGRGLGDADVRPGRSKVTRHLPFRGGRSLMDELALLGQRIEQPRVRVRWCVPGSEDLGVVQDGEAAAQ
jgi:hypothetical protein